MTCKELLKLHNPQTSIDFISDDLVGGCKGCPSEYGYLEDPPYCPNKQNGTRKSNDALCAKCWNREIPECDNKNTILKEDIIGKINSVGNINSIFPDEMHSRKNTFRPASVRAKRVRAAGRNFLLKSPAGVFRNFSVISSERTAGGRGWARIPGWPHSGPWCRSLCAFQIRTGGSPLPAPASADHG